MTYSSGGLIQYGDYNTAAWGTQAGGTYTSTATQVNLAYIHGTGYSRYGYGQNTSQYTQVAQAGIVTATQWSGLVNSLNLTLAHQGQSNITPAFSTITAGSLIQAWTGITTGIATANTQAYAGSVVSRTAAGNTTVNGTTDWGGATNRTGMFTVTMTWASADAARYWWNAGGAIDLSWGLQTQTGTSRITDWVALLQASGTIRLGYNTTTKTGGSGTPATLLSSVNTGGYWLGTTIGGNHPGTATEQFKQLSPNAPYTTDFTRVNAEYKGTTSNGAYPTVVLQANLVNTFSSTFQQTVGSVPQLFYNLQNPANTYFTTTAPTVSVVFADV
jgi:hypothetical protein